MLFSTPSWKPNMIKRCLQNPNSNYSHLLRSCKTLNSLRQIHAHLLLLGAGSTDSIRFLLINSYSSFQNPESALSIFNSTPSPTVLLWNSMIRSFTNAGQHERAIQFYNDMLARAAEPDKYTFTFALKACTQSLDSKNGALVHREVGRRGLQGDVFIATGLVDMYSKLGMVENAYKLFESMPKLDVVAWNAMIAGFSQSSDPYKALGLFREMQSFGVAPNSVTFLNLFPAICELSALLLCRSLHGFITRRGIFPVVCNGLIDAYSKCRKIEVARRIFDGLLLGIRDDVSWATMISGYVYNGCFEEALELFGELRRKNLKPNQVSVVSALSAAAETGDLERGVDVHDYAIQKGMTLDISSTTMLMTMYAKCGEIEKAKLLFDGIQNKDVVAWSAIISAFVQTGHSKEALALFREMRMRGFIPNRVTIVSVLPACANLFEVNLGKSIHCYAMKASIGLDVSVGTALVAMYVQCGLFTAAHALFDGLKHKEVVTWNAMINGYAQIGDASNALKMFHQLRSTGQQPDSGTMVGVLPACALLNALNLGACVHGLILKNGFGFDIHVKNAIIDMYAKCENLPSAEILFIEAKSCRDIVTWNTMIAGYMHNGHADKSLSTFQQMRAENLNPNLVTLVSIVPSTAHLASLRDGSAIHSIAMRTGFEAHVLVGNSLIDMYSKCGRVDYARDLFNWMDYRDTVSWNAMLAGYATHGLSESAIALFSQMNGNGMRPDSASFISVLSACRHGGLVEEGKKIFESMRSEHNLKPSLEHYACMVDLLGRAGCFDEAWGLIQRMPLPADAAIWGALLGACRMHSNVRMGEIALENLVGLEPNNPAHYVVLSNIYSQVGRWADARKMRVAMCAVGMNKTPGCSWVEVK